jgi:hypothetical protein
MKFIVHSIKFKFFLPSMDLPQTFRDLPADINYI